MYREQYEEYEYWCYGAKGKISVYHLPPWVKIFDGNFLGQTGFSSTYYKTTSLSFLFVFCFFSVGVGGLLSKWRTAWFSRITKFRAVFTIPIIIYLKGRPDLSSLLINLVNLSLACKFYSCQLLISRPLSKLCCLDSHFNGCRTLTQYNWWTSLHGAYTSARTQAGEADDRGSHW